MKDEIEIIGPDWGGELDVVLMTLFSKRRPKLLNPDVLKHGEQIGYLATMNGRVILTVHGETRARELFTRPA